MERNFMERGKEWEKEREIKNDKNLEGKREKMEIEGKKGKCRMERCKLMERGKRMESSKRLLLLPPVRVLGATKQPYVALRPPAGCPIQYRAPPQLTGERI